MSVATYEWKKLRHFEGSAVEIPKQVRALLTREEPDDPCYDLERALVGDGEWCKAAAPALDLLLEGLAETPQNATWALRLTANIVGADQSSAWTGTMSSVPEDICAILDHRAEQLWQYLDDPVDEVRSAMGFLIPCLPESLAAEAVQKVLDRLPRESSDVVIASWLLALGCSRGNLSCLEPLQRVETETGPSLRRGAATMALLRAEKPSSWETYAPGVADWLAWSIPPSLTNDFFSTNFWWLHGTIESDGLDRDARRTGLLLGMVMRSVGATTVKDARCQSLIQCAMANPEPRVASAMSEAFMLAFEFHSFPRHKIVSLESLSSTQQELIQATLETTLFFRGAFGVPGPPLARARWCGKAPATQFERIQTVTLNDTEVTAPLYALWARAVPSMTRPIPAMLDLGEGLTRWQVIAEYLAGYYDFGGGGIEHQSLRKEIDGASACSELIDAGPMFVDGVAHYSRQVREQGIDRMLTSDLAAFLLIPLLRQGVSWRADWEALLPSRLRGPYVRELLEGMPTEERTAWLLRSPQTAYDLREALELVEAVPVATAMIRELAEKLRSGKDDDFLAVWAQMETLARSNSVYREAFAQYQREGTPRT